MNSGRGRVKKRLVFSERFQVRYLTGKFWYFEYAVTNARVIA